MRWEQLMSSRGCIVAFLCGALIVASPTSAQTQMSASAMGTANTQAAAASRDAATKAFADLVAFDRTHAFEPLQSAEVKQRARLGPAIPMYFVRLDRLKSYKAGSDPLQLLSAPTTVVYPVLVDRRGASAIEISRAAEGDGWKVSAIEDATFAKALTDVRPQLADAGAASRDVSVWIPAFSQWFFGELEGNALQLTPLFDDPRFGFKKGSALSAGSVFEKLQPAAVKIADDTPGE